MGQITDFNFERLKVGDRKRRLGLEVRLK